MNIWGRLLGFLLGFMVYGPLGALFGFIIGAVFDKGLNLHLHDIPRGHAENVQKAFFTATFSVMGHLAKADGRVSENEIRVAKEMMTQLGLDATLRHEAINLFNVGKSAGFSLENTLDMLWRECHQHQDLLRFFIEIQLEAALADGPLQPAEQKILLVICQRLNISPGEFEQLWARQWASQAFHQWYRAYEDTGYTGTRYEQYDNRYQSGARYRATPAHSSLENACGVLGVSENATPVDIKKAYRRLMNQHHPDKLAARGLPESMVKHAKEKTQQIRAAYDLIREAKGFR